MKKSFYLADLTHESKLGIGSDTMPLQLGPIGAYCLDELGERVDVRLFKYTEEFEKAVPDAPPFLIGFSNYLWNIDLGYKYLQAIKRRFPGVNLEEVQARIGRFRHRLERFEPVRARQLSKNIFEISAT